MAYLASAFSRSVRIDGVQRAYLYGVHGREFKATWLDLCIGMLGTEHALCISGEYDRPRFVSAVVSVHEHTLW